MSQKLTKAQIKSEIKKCGRDPVYFIKNYCKISHPERGLVPFKTYDFQDDLLKDFNDHRFNIVLKARQLGISTIVAGYIAWLLLFRREKSVVVIATKFEVAANLVRKVKSMINHLPEWVRIAKIKINNQTSFELSNGSWIKASSTNESAGRSEALSLLVIDEAAFVDGLEDLWKGIFPTLSTGGRCIALSTPNGVGNWFHETYIKSTTGENDFHHIELPWQVHPERDEEWFEEVTRNLSRRDVAQEHECFAAGTKVYTSFGLRNIEDLKEGDKVLTHKGRFRPIKEIRIKKSDNVYSLSTFLNRNPSLVTGEHPVLMENREWLPVAAIEDGQMVCSSPKNISIERKPDEINIKDYVQPDFFKIKEDGEQIYLNDRKHKVRHKKNVKVDYDLGYFLGLFLAEGSINKNTISFSFNYPDELNTWVDRLCGIVENLFGYDNFSIYNKGKSGVLCINSVIISKFLQSMVDGSYAYDKRLSKEAYVIANKQCLTGILDGFFDGDGCIKEVYDKTTNITSREMIYDLKYIATILGLGRNSIRKSSESKITTIMGRKVNVREQYTLKMLQTRGIMVEKVSDLVDLDYINENSSYKKSHNEDEDFYLTRVVSRKKMDGTFNVYDLEVEEDHSFTTEQFVAHNCNFNASGDSVVSPDDIDCLRGLVVEPLTRTGFDRNYWIWEEYKPDFSYMIIADVSRGDGADFSAAHVFKIETMEQVAEYQGKPSTDMYANLLASVGREYGSALLVVENNNIGYNVLEKLIEMNYPNLYYSIKSTHEYVDQLQAEYQSNSVPGFTTSPKTRPLIVAKMEEFIRNKIVKLSSTRTVEELSTFIWSNGKAQAQKNKNDDLTMSLAIACWVRDTAITSAVRDVEYNKAMLGSIVVANTRMSNQIPGQIGYRSNLDFSGNSVRDQARRQHQMYSWLYKG